MTLLDSRRLPCRRQLDRTRRARDVAAAAALIALAALPTAARQVAGEAPALSNLEGQLINPFASPGRGTALVFMRLDCPVANRYVAELERLRRRAVAAKVGFWLVYVEPDVSAAAVREHLSSFQYSGDALLDPAHRLVRLAGATMTPEAAVFAESGENAMVYRGRIDDLYEEIGRRRQRPTRHDLDEAIEALGQERLDEPRVTAAVGCIIADLR